MSHQNRTHSSVSLESPRSVFVPKRSTTSSGEFSNRMRVKYHRLFDLYWKFALFAHPCNRHGFHNRSKCRENAFQGHGVSVQFMIASAELVKESVAMQCCHKWCAVSVVPILAANTQKMFFRGWICVAPFRGTTLCSVPAANTFRI